MRTPAVTVFVVALALASAIVPERLRYLTQKIVHSRLRINQEPSTASDIAQVVKDNTNFALNLFRTVDERDSNIIFSPYSISVALGMTFAGSYGITKSQMRKTLHFENENIHSVFRDLNKKVIQSGNGIEVKLANSIWSDKNYNFNQDYVELVKNLYQGEVRSVDFRGASEVARQDINAWTANQTNNKIQNVLASAPPASTKLVLVNAIYFKSAWEEPFESSGKKKFNTLNGKNTEAEMMKVEERFEYLEGSGFKSVSIPYKGRKSFLTVILPDEGKFTEVKNSLNTDILPQIFAERNSKLIELTMPKFKIETSLKLKENFKKLGMQVPFYAGADFSRMDGTRDLFIGDIIHKAFIEVNEHGTEAAAATVVVMSRGIDIARPTPFVVDRPFIYVLHDENNSVLFMGQVENPSS